LLLLLPCMRLLLLPCALAPAQAHDCCYEQHSHSS
jgi:hypothetical protein